VTLLLPLAAHEPAALMVLASIPGQALEPYIETPAIQDPLTAQTVGVVFAQQGKLKQAWPLLQAALVDKTPVNRTPEQNASLWYWSIMVAEQMAPARVPALREKILSLAGHGLEIGLAWSAEAQRLEQLQAPPAAIRSAWERAARALPTSHPWHPAAAWRAAKPLLESTQQHELELARDLLLPATSVGDSEDHRRCRFYLAQLYQRLGKPQEAWQLVDSLRSGANLEQSERLERLSHLLRMAISSQVESDPLDAEN
jgi:hypothetical protein